MAFNSNTLNTLRSALDRRIPKDDLPGACEAGADAYVLRHCETDEADRNLITEGIEQLDAIARRKPAIRLPDFPPRQRRAVVRNRQRQRITYAGWFFGTGNQMFPPDCETNQRRRTSSNIPSMTGICQSIRIKS